MIYEIIDTRTGERAKAYELVQEPWAEKTRGCDWPALAVDEDGEVMLTDDCGNYELIDALTDAENPNVLDYIDDAVGWLEYLHSELAAANARCETLSKMVTQYQDELIPSYRERAEKAEAQLSQYTASGLEPCDYTAMRSAIDGEKEARQGLSETLRALEKSNARAERTERERDAAVKFCGKLFALCSPPQKWWPKLFRRLPARAGDYMGSGYSFVDSANRIIDEFTETAEESLYKDVRQAVEEEAQRYKAQEERA